ncbi:MAG: hypothetical protein WD967_00985 [Candidatus Levyibacteriota bacterium]
MQKVQKPEFAAEKWDKKKIVLAILVATALIIGGVKVKNYVLGENTQGEVSNVPESNSRDVKGTNVVPTPTISIPSAQQIGEGLGQNINNIKQEINTINVADLATSSPQVKKILDDIKALPSYPANQAKEICLNFCSGL